MSRHSRRQFLRGSLALVSLGLLAGCGVAPPAAPPIRRVALLTSGDDPPSFADAFRNGLRDLGYTEGQALALDQRQDETADQYPALLDDVIRLGAKVIVVPGSAAALTAKRATSTVPIVFAGVGDPVGNGLVTSLARPGGNITGLSNLSGRLLEKKVELLRDTKPSLVRLAALVRTSNPVSVAQVPALEAATRSLGIELQVLGLREPDELAGVFAAARQGQAEAIIDLAPPYGEQIAELALAHGLPTMCQSPDAVAAGCLMAYNANQHELFRRAAGYVDRILQGASPSDLPVEQPVEFELTLNLKTAQVLGLPIPPAILLQATELVQ